ncbi:MAG: hypothetical protein ACKVS8_02035 [Phycisphaerales bacterium]
MSSLGSAVVRVGVAACAVCVGALVAPAAAQPPRFLLTPAQPAPPKPAWWGPNGGINDGMTETVCYDFNDGVFPNPTPSMLTVAAGTMPPVFSTQLVTGQGDFGVGARRLQVPPPQTDNQLPPNASLVLAQVFDVTNPPDEKEIYVSVDLYANPTAQPLGAAGLPTLVLNFFSVMALPPQPPFMFTVLAAGITPLAIPPGSGYVDAVQIAALIRVCPCPPSYYFGVFQPNGGFDIDNLCIGGRCMPAQPKAAMFNAPGLEFMIPAPGAAALMGCAGLLALRRRR